MLLKKVISGGQTGADTAGVATAKKYGLHTGGTMPHGFKTLDGPKPQFANLYGMKQHASESYVPRTYQNVIDSDGTIRIAADFNSRGEICTLKAIKKNGRPHIDVNMHNPKDPSEVIQWIKDHGIEVLNVAGNSEQTYMGIGLFASDYLSKVFEGLGFHV